MENRLSANDEKLLESFKNNVLDKFPDAISRKLPQGELYAVYTNDNPLKGERLSVNPFEGKTATSELQAWKEASEKVLGQRVSQNNDLNNNGIPDRKERDLNNNGIDDKLESSMKNKFSLESIPFSDLQKIGISRMDILKNTEDLNKLLAGEKTNSIPISKFDALDVKVQLELVRNNSNEVKLVVTPNQMEMKTEHQKNVDSLLKIDGVIKDSTS